MNQLQISLVQNFCQFLRDNSAIISNIRELPFITLKRMFALSTMINNSDLRCAAGENVLETELEELITVSLPDESGVRTLLSFFDVIAKEHLNVHSKFQRLLYGQRRDRQRFIERFGLININLALLRYNSDRDITPYLDRVTSRVIARLEMKPYFIYPLSSPDLSFDREELPETLETVFEELQLTSELTHLELSDPDEAILIKKEHLTDLTYLEFFPGLGLHRKFQKYNDPVNNTSLPLSLELNKELTLASHLEPLWIISRFRSSEIRKKLEDGL